MEFFYFFALLQERWSHQVRVRLQSKKEGAIRDYHCWAASITTILTERHNNNNDDIQKSFISIIMLS